MTMTLIATEEWYVGIPGVLTDVDQVVGVYQCFLADPTGSYGIYDNTIGAIAVAANTVMPRVATGVYQYPFTATAGHVYTAYRHVIYKSASYYLPQVINAPAGTPAPLTYGYQQLVNAVGLQAFGLRPTATDVITDAVASTTQASDIMRAIQDGLLYVYNSHRWSFMRPVVSINTLPAYSTGTVIIDASGNVTLAGGSFPAYAASSKGQIWVGTSVPPYYSGGIYAVGTYNSATSVALTNYTGPMLPPSISSGSGGSTDATGYIFTWGTPTTAVVGQYVVVYSATGSATIGSYLITKVTGTTSVTLATSPGANLTSVSWNLASVAGIAYNLVFNTYALPTGFDIFEEDLTEPSHGTWHRHSLRKVDEIEIRRHLQHFDGNPHRPEMYAITVNQLDPTAGSSRYVTFWPIPGIVHTFYGKAILRPTQLDSSNTQPMGIEILAPVFMESCLAAAERLIDQMDAMAPDAVHNRALTPLLAMAIQRDKENASPDTLGIDYGRGEHDHNHHLHYRGQSIYWQNSIRAGGYQGWL